MCASSSNKLEDKSFRSVKRYLNSLLSMDTDCLVISFDMDAQPVATHNAT